MTTIGDIDSAGTITANSAVITASTIGLTTQPTMNVTTLDLTLNAQIGGWSGKMLKGVNLVDPNNVTVTALGIPLVFGGIPASVSINGWSWGTSPPPQPQEEIPMDISRFTRSYLSPHSVFIEKIYNLFGSLDYYITQPSITIDTSSLKPKPIELTVSECTTLAETGCW